MPPSSKTTAPNTSDPIRQFSLYVENKVGTLHDLVVMLGGADVHVLALTVIDITESAIVRFVVDDPDKAFEVLRQHGFYVNESEVLGVELESEADLRPVLAALLEAEVNIHYLYPFLVRPNGKYALLLHVEDRDLGAQTLTLHHRRVLHQHDLSR
jgi:hypothetical protein